MAIKHFGPVYLHDASCRYIPYPVPMVSRFSVGDPVDDRVNDSVNRIVEQRTDDATSSPTPESINPALGRVRFTAAAQEINSGNTMLHPLSRLEFAP